MNIIGIVAFAVVGALVLLGLVWWYYSAVASKKKYPFLYYKSATNVVKTNGRLRYDRVTKKKFFTFDFTEDKLEIRPATRDLDGVSYREITTDRKGDLIYLQAGKIVDERYLQVALEPEEKILALEKYKEIEARFQNPMEKSAVALMAGAFVLVLLIMIGIVYVTISYSNSIKDAKELSVENTKTAQANREASQATERAATIFAQVAVTLTDMKGNITRSVS